MKKLLICIFVIGVLSTTFAQEIEIKLLSNSIADIQAFSLGDSVFLCYSEKNAATGLMKKRASIIYDNNISNIFFEETEGSTLIDVFKFTSKYALYFIKGSKRKLELSIIEIDILKKTRTKSTTDFNIEGAILCTFFKDNFHLLSYSAEKKALLIYIFSGVELINKIEIPVIDEIRNYLSDLNIEFLQEGVFSGSSIGAIPVNIIQTENEIIIAVDQVMVNRTTILKIDIPSYTFSNIKIKYEYSENWKSIIFQNHIYRFNDANNIWIEKYKIVPFEKVGSFEFDANHFSEYTNYIRKGKEHSIIKKTNILKTKESKSRSISGGKPNLSILLSSGENCNSIRIGSYYNDNPTAFVGGNPLQALTSYIILRTINSLAEGPGISSYFYIKDTNDQFTFSLENEPGISINQQIDNYEIDLEKNHKVKYKGYLSSKEKMFGIYLLRDKKVILVKKF